MARLWFEDMPEAWRPDRFGGTERTTSRFDGEGVAEFAKAWDACRLPLVLRRSRPPKYVVHMENGRLRGGVRSYVMSSVYVPSGAPDVVLDSLLRTLVKAVRPSFAMASLRIDIDRKHRMTFMLMGSLAEGMRGLEVDGEEAGYRWTLPGAYPRMYFGSAMLERIPRGTIEAAPARSRSLDEDGLWVSLTGSVRDAGTSEALVAEEAFRCAVGPDLWFDRRKLPMEDPDSPSTQSL